MTPTLRSRRAAVLAAVALLLAPVAACSSSGGGSDEDPAPTTTTTEATGEDTTSTTTGDDPDPDRTTVPDDTTTTEVEDPEPDGDADEDAYVDALGRAFLAESNTDLPLDADQAECIAPRWVDAIGVDRFVDGGVTPDDLVAATDDTYFDLIDGIGDAETAEQLAGSFAECGIDLTELVAGLLGDEGTATPEQVACFVDAVPDGAIESSLVAALDGDDETGADFDDEVSAAAETCFE